MTSYRDGMCLCRVSAVIGDHSIKIQKSSLMMGKSGHGERMGCSVKMEDARRKRSPHEKGTQKEVIMEKKREEREERDI